MGYSEFLCCAICFAIGIYLGERGSRDKEIRDLSHKVWERDQVVEKKLEEIRMLEIKIMKLEKGMKAEG